MELNQLKDRLAELSAELEKLNKEIGTEYLKLDLDRLYTIDEIEDEISTNKKAMQGYQVALDRSREDLQRATDNREGKSEIKSILEMVESFEEVIEVLKENIDNTYIKKAKLYEEYLVRPITHEEDIIRAKLKSMYETRSELEDEHMGISIQIDSIESATNPLTEKINDLQADNKKLAKDKMMVVRLEERLASASTASERRKIHLECESNFGKGNPKTLLAEIERAQTSNDRNTNKLTSRLVRVAHDHLKDIELLIIDGNNLCYEGDTFIGFSALKEFYYTVSNLYEVKIVFDHGIKGLLGTLFDEMMVSFADTVPHVCELGVEADDVILNLASSNERAYVVSNDRFADYPDKEVVITDRFIRHIIIDKKILPQGLPDHDDRMFLHLHVKRLRARRV
tara:strand:- start:9136 stop:10326 length:1191 start_codon:yes stop_codon:yes gene_type:complete